MEFIYWIKFDDGTPPEKVIVQNFQELLRTIEQLALIHRHPPEWIIRDYR